MTTRGVGLSEEERVREILVAHQHGGRVHSREGWVECSCGEKLPCEFDGPPHHDPAWDVEVDWASDMLAIQRHQAAIVAARPADLAAQVARVEALADRWAREAVDRGPFDEVYTDGVVAMLRAALSPAQPDTEACPKCGSRKVSTDGVRWCAVCDDCPTPQPDTERGGGS